MPWIAPNTILEKTYASAVVMVGAIFFASLLGSIVSAIAAIERSNAQRRDKMTLMHSFCTSRRLGPNLKSGMTRYVDAMFAFNNDVEGTERLGNLPNHLRSSLLEVIYSRMLGSCELLQTTSRQTALALCQHIQPQVCPAKSVLVERNSIATHLFLLHRGALHVTLGEELNASSPAKAKGGTPGQARRGSGPHTKGKAMLRVRVCERMGAFVGVYDPYDVTVRLPLEVTAVKLSQLFAIQRIDLIDVMETVGDHEANKLYEALLHEKNVVLEALKYNRPDRPKPPPKKIDVVESGANGSDGGTAGVMTPDSPSPGPSPACRRASTLGEPGNRATVKAAARSTARRKSTVNATVGSLLSAGGASATTMGVNEAAAAAANSMWDDAVTDVKMATRSLEDVAIDYKHAVNGFVEGLDGLAELMMVLQKLPENTLPQAPGPRVKHGSLALPSFRGPAESPFGGRLRMPQLVPLQLEDDAEPAPTGGDKGTPDSGRPALFDNIAKIGSVRGLPPPHCAAHHPVHARSRE